MDLFKMLLELQEKRENIKKCVVVLKDRKNIVILKNMKSEFETIKTEYNEKKKLLKDLNLQYERLSNESSEAKDECKQLESRLYERAGSDLKLIQNLQNKINITKSKLKELEEKAFKILEEEEKQDKMVKQLKSTLIGIKNKHTALKDECSCTINNARKEYEEAKEKSVELEKNIPSDLLQKFNIIFKEKGTGAAVLRSDVCRGCGMKVSSLTIDSIKKKDSIVYCDNCGRIVYCNNSQ